MHDPESNKVPEEEEEKEKKTEILEDCSPLISEMGIARHDQEFDQGICESG
jgi:hypothetical protein